MRLANALFSVCLLLVRPGHRLWQRGWKCGYLFYLQDIIVLPAFQGKGLGKRIMTAVMAYIEAYAHLGVFIGLIAAKGVEDFYTQFGFSVRPPQRSGMFRIIV